jgi:cytochrome P450
VITAIPAIRPAGRPFDPPEGLAELREQRPLTRFRYPDGHEGWLATGHAVVRDVLGDQRFSARSELRHMPAAGIPGTDRPAPPGAFIAMDPPDHTRYRRLLGGRFTTRRMRLLADRIGAVTGECLDAMERRGGPVDLVAALAQPVPAQVMCELLGVPYEDRDGFERSWIPLFALGASAEEVAAAVADLNAYLGALVAAKRAQPADDLLGDLTATELTDEELVGIGFLLLGAGLDTTTNMIALGAHALMAQPDQLALMRDEPGNAVEELLRYLSVVPVLVRTALEDVELHGELVKAGESVTLSVPAADRDPARFPDPDALDVRRDTAGHVAFGHGVHQCLGQQLARVEMRVVLPALFERFPKLRLAVPAEELRMREDMLVYGVHELPVDWR